MGKRMERNNLRSLKTTKPELSEVARIFRTYASICVHNGEVKEVDVEEAVKAALDALGLQYD